MSQRTLTSRSQVPSQWLQAGKTGSYTNGLNKTRQKLTTKSITAVSVVQKVSHVFKSIYCPSELASCVKHDMISSFFSCSIEGHLVQMQVLRHERNKFGNSDQSTLCVLPVCFSLFKSFLCNLATNWRRKTYKKQKKWST